MKIRCGFVTNSSSSSFVLKFKGEYNPETHQYERESGYDITDVRDVMKYICEVIEDLYGGHYNRDNPYKEGEDYVISDSKDHDEIKKIFSEMACWDSDDKLSCPVDGFKYSAGKAGKVAYKFLTKRIGIESEFDCNKSCPLYDKCVSLTEVAADGDVFIVTQENVFPAEFLKSLLDNSFDLEYYNLHMG